jgi:hypothetical protein
MIIVKTGIEGKKPLGSQAASPAPDSSSDSQAVSMAMIVQALSLLKDMLNRGLISESDMQKNLLNAQTAVMKYQEKTEEDMAKQQGKVNELQKIMAPLATIGLVLTIVGLVFLPALAAAGLFDAAAGACKIVEAKYLKKIANDQGHIQKSAAFLSYDQDAIQTVQGQLKTTTGSQTQIQEALNAILYSMGQAQRSAEL